MSDERIDHDKLRTRQELRRLADGFRQTLGNKRYMVSIDTLFARIEIATSEELEAIRFLISDLNSLKNDVDREKRRLF